MTPLSCVLTIPPNNRVGRDLMRQLLSQGQEVEQELLDGPTSGVDKDPVPQGLCV